MNVSAGLHAVDDVLCCRDANLCFCLGNRLHCAAAEHMRTALTKADICLRQSPPALAPIERPHCVAYGLKVQ